MQIPWNRHRSWPSWHHPTAWGSSSSCRIRATRAGPGNTGHPRSGRWIWWQLHGVSQVWRCETYAKKGDDIIWLVVWLPIFIFPFILGCDYHPNWRTHIFQRGGPGPPTSNKSSNFKCPTSKLQFQLKRLSGHEGVAESPRRIVAFGFVVKNPSLQGGASPVISWFIIPITIDITPESTLVIVLMNQLSYYGAPPCGVVFWLSQHWG